MSIDSATRQHPNENPAPASSYLAWLATCFVIGLLFAPVFDAMPARVKFLGLHSWALSAGISAACTWSAAWWGIRSLRLVSLVSLGVSLGALLLLAHWGFTELKQATAQRMPMLPMPKTVGSPEEVARTIQMQHELARALVPTFTDYQRRRMNFPMLHRIRPVALWLMELLIAAVVSVLTSRAVYQQMKKNSDFDSLPGSGTVQQ